MARRGIHTKDELKSLIFNASKDIAKEEGLENLSVRKIAKKISYTPGTIYSFFENIDDLILHINSETLDQLYAYILTAVSKHKDQISVIREIANSYVNFSYENYNLWSTLFDYHYPQKTGKNYPDWYQKKIDKLFSLVEENLEVLLKDFKQAQISARILWASMHGICTLAHSGKLGGDSSCDTHILVENYLQIFLRGLK